jgi:hypothetical protein
MSCVKGSSKQLIGGVAIAGRCIWNPGLDLTENCLESWSRESSDECRIRLKVAAPLFDDLIGILSDWPGGEHSEQFELVERRLLAGGDW